MYPQSGEIVDELVQDPVLRHCLTSALTSWRHRQGYAALSGYTRTRPRARHTADPRVSHHFRNMRRPREINPL
jgi:hypothetical protein